MKSRISRRAALGAIPAMIAGAVVPNQKSKPITSIGEITRVIDPATENPLARLSSLWFVSELPNPANRFIASKGRFIVFSSNRSGSFAPYRLDLRTGIPEKIATTTKLDVRSLMLDGSERTVRFLDDGKIKEINLSNKRERVLADGVTQFASAGDRLLIQKSDSIETSDGGKIVSAATRLLSPDRSGRRCLFTRGDELWWTDLATPNPKRLLAAPVAFPFWSEDASVVFFLRPSQAGSQIMQIDVETLALQTISIVSPIAAFGPNANATVFAAALSSRAQPFILLMLRFPKRETTLCEHHATDPSAVTPVFSPDSRRVYFQSNREGNNAIYSINVSALVEPTAGEGE